MKLLRPILSSVRNSLRCSARMDGSTSAQYRRRSDTAWQRRARQAPVAFAQGDENYVVMTDDFIGRELFTKGFFDHPKLDAALFALGLNRVGMLVNIGANIGDVCIPALLRGQADRVFAVEPDRINFALLKINVDWNDCGSRTTCIPAALSDSRNPIRLSQPDWGNRGGFYVDGEVSAKADAVVRAEGIQCFLLDDFRLNLGKSDLIFMDVEGHELQVLRGSQQTLADGVPVVLEFSADFLATSEVDELIDLLRPRQRFVNLRDVGEPQELFALQGLRNELLSRNRKRQTDVVIW